MYKIIRGTVKEGYGVASGLSRNSPYPTGSIIMQIPHLRKLGLDLSGFYPATINVSIYPNKLRQNYPEYTFKNVKWSENHPAEDFSFSGCKLIYRDKTYKAYIYYPHPETKPDHFHDDSTIEIITSYINNIYYGVPLTIMIKSNTINIVKI